MTQFLAAGWLLQKTLSFAGLAAMLAGVAIFGWYFVRINALAAQGETGDIPPESWRGTGAKYGLFIFAAGVALALSSVILASMLPGRY
jgi:hypothetical protein